MGDQEVHGFLLLLKDRLVFRSKTGLGKGNLEQLKKLDEELFQNEIASIQDNNHDWEGFIDFHDVVDVKILVFESIADSSVEGEYVLLNNNASGEPDLIKDFHL